MPTKTLKMWSQSHPEIANPVPDPSVSVLLLPWSPRVPSRCQTGPQGPNIHKTALVNRSRSELKGAGGKGRGREDIVPNLVAMLKPGTTFKNDLLEHFQ